MRQWVSCGRVADKSGGRRNGNRFDRTRFLLYLSWSLPKFRAVRLVLFGAVDNE